MWTHKRDLGGQTGSPFFVSLGASRSVSWDVAATRYMWPMKNLEFGQRDREDEDLYFVLINLSLNLKTEEVENIFSPLYTALFW